MTFDTATAEGRQKRLEQLLEGYLKSGNKVAAVRLIGGSIEDFGGPADSGSHPDEKLEDNN